MTNQLQFERVEGAAPLKSDPTVAWFGCSSDTPFEWAEKRFTEKHGHKPATLTRFGGWLRVGPIGEEA